MKLFDNKVQETKYKVLREVAYQTWKGNDVFAEFNEIANNVIPKGEPPQTCCIYKDRAVVAERMRLAIGGSKKNDNIVQVIDIACDECPMGGYEVTNSCRGCLAHRCESVCRFGAISFDHNHTAVIDKSKCKECGACSRVCPYSAIRNYKRPCEQACKVKAISMGKDGEACIDDSKCISCGACVYQCPFGAITDKSFILDAIKLLRLSERVYAIVAPAIVSQFTYAKPGQVITAIKALGFCDVLEAALGADMVAYNEAAELAERGFLTSSCCPAFVSYIRKSFPELQENISHNMSPMATIAKRIKEKDPEAKTVFIGPCTAKKGEFQLPEVHKYVDCVLTFEELQAMFDSRELDVAGMEETVLNNAYGYGRILAHCGGLAEAAAEALKEQGIDFELKPLSCNGIEECKLALMKAARGKLDANFVEGMACVGGCVNGAGCMTHNERNRVKVDAHSQQAQLKSITDSLLYAAEIDRELKEKAGDKA